MAASLEVDVRDQVGDELFERLAKLKNLRPLLSEIGEIVRTSVMRNFEEQRSPEGVSWRPSKRAATEGGQTLILHGILRNSIHVQVTGDTVEVGTPVKYGVTHQFGAKAGEFGNILAVVRSHIRTSIKGKEYKVKAHTRRMLIPWGDIPARPWLGVRDEDWQDIRETILRYVGGE